jgi:probable selenium-dependent hydroxylase accessory protein YqeC
MSLTIIDVIRELDFPRKVLISLTGGGGKTSLLEVLGHAFKSVSVPVLLTTTTKVQKPFPVLVDWFVEESNPEAFLKKVLARLEPQTLGLALRKPYGKHKWDGIPPETLDALYNEMDEGVILNEADGAFRLPVKAPAAHEPVIPLSTTHVIPILGLSALGVPLDETHAFRPNLIARITGLAIGEAITETAMARLFTHPEGLARGTPSGVNVIPFLNQADHPFLEEAGRRIAREIFLCSENIRDILVGKLKPAPSFDLICRDSEEEING